jgi:hypothetical protein
MKRATKVRRCNGSPNNRHKAASESYLGRTGVWLASVIDLFVVVRHASP